MATNTLEYNIRQTAGDFADIKTAITEKGVEVPGGTPTQQYPELIRAIPSGSIDDFLAAILRTIDVTGHGGIIDKLCEPFTKEILSLGSIWRENTVITAIDASFEKLTQSTNIFNRATNLRSVKTDFSNLETGQQMFTLVPLVTFEVANNIMPELGYARGMFWGTRLTEFHIGMPKLENGEIMFSGCGALRSFRSDTSSLKVGYLMFRDCTNLVHFDSPLSSLEDGSAMFDNCPKLSVESLQKMIVSLPDRSQTTTGNLGISKANLDKLDSYYAELMTSKNWKIG